MEFPRLTKDELLRRLEKPAGRVRMVLDTDTYNEIDDQFALMYALGSPEQLEVEAVYAAPFYNHRSFGPEDGMEKSYQEILRLLRVIGRGHQGFVYRGSKKYLPGPEEPVESEAAWDLVARAGASAENAPLYVVAIGAVTNVASAILLRPEIIRRIVVVWLGGHPLHWPHTREFNLKQDIWAARVIFDCGAPLIQVPCMGVASHLLTTIYELEAHLAGKNRICDELLQLFRDYHADHFGWAKEIWDIGAVACLVHPTWTPMELIPSPILTGECTWRTDPGRHLMKTVIFIHRNMVFKDLFQKLTQRFS
ncbi:MAG: nucleoside hydrolase [Firmicutes bacterium]|nr:nucleoside hydrolase [Bacillota bacterium]